MFIFWFFAGALSTGIVFTLFYRKNLGTLERARQALLKAYDTVEGEAKKLFEGVDKKLDKAIEKRKVAERNRPAPKPAPKPEPKTKPKTKAKVKVKVKAKAKALTKKPRAKKAK